MRNSFLPALNLLGSEFEVVGVHSRNPAHARSAAEPFGVSVIDDLLSVRPGDVDAVMVSVTPTANLAVLQAVGHLAHGSALVLDTPAAVGWPELRHATVFRRWGAVRVAEDFMNLPQFRLIGKVIASGAIGDPVRIRVESMGYRYHALALLRSWLDFPDVRSAQSRNKRGGAVDIVYRFPGGATGEVIEPFTGSDGVFEVVGTRGCVAGHSMGHPIDDHHAPAGAAGRPVGRLERIQDEHGLSGFRVVGLGAEIAEITEPVPAMARLRAMGLEDDSEFNLVRVDALCNVISSLYSPDPLNTRYRLQDGMADALVSHASRARWPLPQVAGPNVAKLVERAFS